MAEYNRTAAAVWTGDLRGGSGKITTGSGIIKEAGYTFSTRFENQPGTNPEELLAAASAACFSMAFANILKQNGCNPVRIATEATCNIAQKDGGWRITGIRLEVHAQVPGIDQDRFRELALEADQNCPVSVALHEGIGTEVVTNLE